MLYTQGGNCTSKLFLEAEKYHNFGSMREKLIDEFFDANLDTDDLVNLLNMVDDIHIRFLSEQMLNIEETIKNFRQFFSN